MWKATIPTTRTFLLVVSTVLGAAEVNVRAAFKAGDVVVAKRRAALRVGDRTMGTVAAGDVLQVQLVRGHWLWVTHRQSGYLVDTDVMSGEEAEKMFSMRIAANRANLESLRARGYLRLLQGNTDGALADFGTMLEFTQASPLVYSDRGMAWFFKGRYDRALADFNFAVLHPYRTSLSDLDQATLFSRRGLALLSTGRVDQAIEDFNRAIRMSDGKLVTGFSRRGLAFLSQGNANERAIADLNRAIELNKLDLSAINARGLAWLRLGMFDNAADDFRKVIGLSPEGPFVRSTTSDLLYRRAAADDQWHSDSIRQINPRDSAYYNLAILLAAGPSDVRDAAEARSVAESACQLDEDHYYAFPEALAAVCAAEGDFENACRYQRRAIVLAPDEEREKQLEKQLSDYQAGRPFRLQTDAAR